MFLQSLRGRGAAGPRKRDFKISPLPLGVTVDQSTDGFMGMKAVIGISLAQI